MSSLLGLDNGTRFAHTVFDEACAKIVDAGWRPDQCKIIESPIKFKRQLWVDYREVNGMPEGVLVFQIELVDYRETDGGLDWTRTFIDMNVQLRWRWADEIPAPRPSLLGNPNSMTKPSNGRAAWKPYCDACRSTQDGVYACMECRKYFCMNCDQPVVTDDETPIKTAVRWCKAEACTLAKKEQHR